MTDADLFDEFFTLAKRGRRLGRLGLPWEVNEAYERYIGRARAGLESASLSLPKLPTVYADFVTNPAFNAFAFKHRDRYFIAFNDGLPVILTTVIYRMLADGRLFPQVGDSAAEATGLPLFRQLRPNAAQLFYANPWAIVPKDRQRQIYAIHLCHLVFDFLSAHEIAHIANGHVDYKAAERGIPYVGEVGWLPDTPEGNLESQAMELDADSTAARVLVQTVKGLVSSRDRMRPEIAALYKEPAGAMFDVSVAVSVVFRLFQDSRMDGVDVSGVSHPPTRWRQMQILNMMGNYVAQGWGGGLVEQVCAALTKAIADVEEAFELITGTGQQVQGLHDAWSGAGWDYAAAISDCWNSTLRQKVAKYAFIEPNSYHFDRPQPAPSSSDRP
ncbi:MAG: hypothetical protein V4719_24795 [Planctomycetota bacterium]